MNETVAFRHSVWRQTRNLVAWGLLGVLSLLWQPVPETLMRQRPELAEMPVWQIKLLGLLNPMVLLVVAALLGAVLAHRVGLRSVVAGTARPDDGLGGWWVAAAAGLATGTLVVLLDVAAAPWLGDAWSRFLGQASRPDVADWVMGVFYGGITEEILMRWGFMSALAWVLWCIGGKGRMGPAIGAAIGLTALVFGVAHLPALGTQVELTGGVVLRTVCLNALAALVYGWLYWRHHLEAAMLGHACSHLAMGVTWTLL